MKNLFSSLCTLAVAAASLRLFHLVAVVDGAVVEYTWNVKHHRARPPLSPDCFVDKDVLLVNGMHPGPEIRANVGDTIRIVVNNQSPDVGLTMHYHGITMFGQPYADGTNSRSQCNLSPMQSQVNEFIITERDVGLHYWHGHTSLERMDGLQGAIIIENPEDPDEVALKETYDEERVIFLEDWYHRTGMSNRIGLDSVPFIWIGNANSFLINGKGLYEPCEGANATEVPTCADNCTMDNYLAAVDVEAGKKYLFHIINAASLIAVNFAVANHSLTVVKTEGTFVHPVTVTSLDIGVAERYSVILEANQESASYWMSTGVRFRNAGPQGLAYLRYDGSDLPDSSATIPDHPEWEDYETWWNFTSLLKTKDPSKYEEFSALSSSSTPDYEYIVVGNQAVNNVTGNLRWVMNNISTEFPGMPTVLKAYQAVKAEGALAWPRTLASGIMDLPLRPESPWDYVQTMQDAGAGTNLQSQADLVIRLEMGAVVDLVLQNARALNGVAEYHGWHLHGHKFWLIGQGNGTYDPDADPAKFNLVDPVMRDTVALLPYGWTAIRFVADNAGAWPMHCVLAAHLVMGMGFTVVTSPELLPPPPPAVSSCLRNSLDVQDEQLCVAASTVGTTGSASSPSIYTSMVSIALSVLCLAGSFFVGL